MNRTARDQTRELTPAPASAPPLWAPGKDPTGCLEAGQGHIAGVPARSPTRGRHATSRPHDTASTAGFTHDGGNQKEGSVEEEEEFKKTQQ
jgi:hypothetical protein